MSRMFAVIPTSTARTIGRRPRWWRGRNSNHSPVRQLILTNSVHRLSNLHAAAMMEEAQQAQQPFDHPADSVPVALDALANSGPPAPQTLSPSAAAAFAELIRHHGDSTDQFKLFCKANGPLAALRQLWVRKADQCPGELPMQLIEWDNFETARLLKGLLRVAGFMAESHMSNGRNSESAATHEWEDAGDLCCLDTVDSDIVQFGASEPDARQWLDANAKWIQARFQCKMSSSYPVADVVRALRAALKKVGLALVRRDKKTKVCSDGGPPRTVTSWTLVSPQRDSLLELAYSDSLRFRPVYAQAAGASSADWDVAATLDIHQPVFRWQALTGVERPAHWRPPDPTHIAAAGYGQQLAEPVSPGPSKKKRKRKRVIAEE